MSTSISEMQTVGKSALLEMLLEQDTFTKLVADVCLLTCAFHYEKSAFKPPKKYSLKLNKIGK